MDVRLYWNTRLPARMKRASAKGASRAVRRPEDSRSEPAPTKPGAYSPGAVADSIGHCVLVFAFVPALAVIPGWLFFESTNPLNVREPLVLSFLLVRGVDTVLNAFYAGIVAGVLTGFIYGVLVCAWLWSGARVSTQRQLYLSGAIGGALAACLMVVVVATVQAFAGQERIWGAGAIAFEVVSGLVCGTIAVPTAARLLRGATLRSNP
jgi:hypothetical protein